jgi:hypothetical protein
VGVGFPLCRAIEPVGEDNCNPDLISRRTSMQSLINPQTEGDQFVSSHDGYAVFVGFFIF